MQNAAYEAEGAIGPSRDEGLSAEELCNQELASVSSDLNVQFLHEVLVSAYDPHVTSISSHAPLGSKNTTFQIRVTENLRQRLSALGWESSDKMQLACICNPAAKLRIACSTDGGPSIGLSHSAEPVLREKGDGTLRLAGHESGDTMPLPGFEEYFQKEKSRKLDNFAFYYLLHRFDETCHEIRSELSEPIFGEHGKLLRWNRRIIIPPVPVVFESSISVESIPIPEIEVTRKTL